MKKIIIALALSASMLGMASCTRGGNADRGDDGYIGNHGKREEAKAEEKSGRSMPERELDTEPGYHGGDVTGREDGSLGDDLYNLPRDARRGIDRSGDDIGRDLRDIGNGIKDSADRFGNDVRRDMRENDVIK